jgi:hypothetical protein
MRISVARGGVVVGLLVVGACSKPPTPAALESEAFVVDLAKRAPLTNHLDEGVTTTISLEGGEPEEGTVATYMDNRVGTIDWTRAKTVKDQPLANGDHQVEVNLDVCERSDNGANCTRPNSFGFKLLVHNVDGAWRIAGGTCTQLNNVR